MRDWLRRKLPTDESLQTHPGLRWMGPLLRRPWLWHLNRRRTAIGAGIGVFFGFMIPVLQIAGAALLALVLRANLPVAVLSTLVSNPFTYAPIGVLAYKTGAAILGEPVAPASADAAGAAAAARDSAPGWIDRAKTIGKPLLVGLAVFAVVGGIGAWAAVHLAWTVAVRLKRRRRRRKRTG